MSAMAECGSGPSVSNPAGAKKRSECHFDSRWLKEFESEGIKKSSKGNNCSLLRGVAPKFSARHEHPALTF